MTKHLITLNDVRAMRAMLFQNMQRRRSSIEKLVTEQRKEEAAYRKLGFKMQQIEASKVKKQETHAPRYYTVTGAND